LKSTSPPVTPHGGETDIRNEDSFAFPSPPKTPLEHTGTGIYVGARPGSFRASGGKGKLPTGWLVYRFLSFISHILIHISTRIFHNILISYFYRSNFLCKEIVANLENLTTFLVIETDLSATFFFFTTPKKQSIPYYSEKGRCLYLKKY